MKSLDRDVYRNLEFDVWQDTCKGKLAGHVTNCCQHWKRHECEVIGELAVFCADRDAEDGVHGVCRQAILPGRQMSGNAQPSWLPAPPRTSVSAVLDMRHRLLLALISTSSSGAIKHNLLVDQNVYGSLVSG